MRVRLQLMFSTPRYVATIGTWLFCFGNRLRLHEGAVWIGLVGVTVTFSWERE